MDLCVTKTGIWIYPQKSQNMYLNILYVNKFSRLPWSLHSRVQPYPSFIVAAVIMPPTLRRSCSFQSITFHWYRTYISRIVNTTNFYISMWHYKRKFVWRDQYVNRKRIGRAICATRFYFAYMRVFVYVCLCGFSVSTIVKAIFFQGLVVFSSFISFHVQYE